MERNRKRKSRSKSAADDFSDINDAEINGYLNDKTGMLFKKLMWEAMNKCYAKKKQIMSATEKKSSAKKAVAGRMENVNEKEPEKKKRLSSKINYDALEKLTDEIPGEVTEKPKEGGTGSNSDKEIEREHSKGTSSSEVCGFEEDNYSDEFESENANLYSCGVDEEEESDYREDYDEYEEF
ncbi:hypothetical protein HRI_002271900 [Hibiscus trionum]|uniref:Brf1 TBP-binding domain-containing protein n=1 Tax=Hibiscus trionum TaxID=183268 RepID=A0A9W7HZ51_HIBTR|nr:hypothetical protein HRI_002271900 [Hibiscus trionum]